MPLKTLLLNPPSFENFDGGAASRWPATREIESYWYPVWLAYPAGMLEGSRLLDAPSHHVSSEETIKIARDYEFLVLFTSTPGWPGDIKLAEAIKGVNPGIKIAFVGPHVTTLPEKSLRDCPAIDFVCRKEFDHSVVEFANGKPLDEITGISFLRNGSVVHTADRPASAGSGFVSSCHRRLQTRFGHQTLYRPVLALSVCLALHDAGMSSPVYLLPLAADVERAPLA